MKVRTVSLARAVSVTESGLVSVLRTESDLCGSDRVQVTHSLGRNLEPEPQELCSPCG